MQKEIKQLSALMKYGKDLRLAAEKWESDYETLFATILSARTRDEITILVSKELFKKYGSVKKLAKAELNDIEKLIRPINFYKTKSRNILNCSKEIIKLYQGEIPHDFEKLTKLSGVGRKTANVFLAVIGRPSIGVDTHVSYISQKLDWTENTNPHKIEKDLQKLFPKKHWRNLNYIVVRFGRTHTSRKEKDMLLEKIKKIK